MKNLSDPATLEAYVTRLPKVMQSYISDLKKQITRLEADAEVLSGEIRDIRSGKETRITAGYDAATGFKSYIPDTDQVRFQIENPARKRGYDYIEARFFESENQYQAGAYTEVQIMGSDRLIVELVSSNVCRLSIKGPGRRTE